MILNNFRFSFFFFIALTFSLEAKAQLCLGQNQQCNPENSQCCFQGPDLQNEERQKFDCLKVDAPEGVSNWRSLYAFSSQCKPQGQEVDMAQAALECCSGQADSTGSVIVDGEQVQRGVCRAAYKCVKRTGFGEILQGISQCGSLVHPSEDGIIDILQLIPNDSQTITEENSETFETSSERTCRLPQEVVGATPTSTVAQGPDLSSTSTTGEQCQVSMDQGLVDQFIANEGFFMGSEFVMATNEKRDHFKFLEKGTEYSLSYSQCRIQAQGDYLAEQGRIEAEYQAYRTQQESLQQVQDSFGQVTTLNGSSPAGEFSADGLSVKMIQLQGDYFKALANKDRAMQGCYDKALGEYRKLARRIQGTSWGCRKIIDVERGIFVPCVKSCKKLFKRNRDCPKQCTDKITLTMQDGQVLSRILVDPFWPKDVVKKTGEQGEVLASFEEAFIEYAQSRLMNFQVDHSLAEDFNPGANRGMDLKQMSREAYSFYYNYAQTGSCKLPGPTRSLTITKLADAAAELLDFHTIAANLRDQQSSCLYALAERRDQASASATVLEDRAAQRLLDANSSNLGLEEGSGALVSSSSAQGAQGGLRDLASNLASSSSSSSAQSTALQEDVAFRQNRLSELGQTFGSDQASSFLSDYDQFRESSGLISRASPSSLSSGSSEEALLTNKNISESAVNKNTKKTAKAKSKKAQNLKAKKTGSSFLGLFPSSKSDGLGFSEVKLEESASRSPGSLSRQDTQVIIRNSQSSRYKGQAEDDLFEKVSKAYVRFGYPILLEPIAPAQ